MANLHGRWDAPRVRTSWWARLGAAGAAALSLVVAAGPPGDATLAQVPPSAAFFVGTDGAVATYGQAADGSRPDAADVGSSGIAPAGAAVATVRTPNGGPIVAVVGRNGSLFVGGCTNQSVMSAVTGPEFAMPGVPLAAVLAADRMWLATEDKPGGLIMKVMEASNPCTPVPVPVPHVTAAWLGAGAAITATGLADGRVGVFAVDTTGAVHALWLSPNGQTTDSTLTPAGTASPGGGIAVTPNSEANAGPGALSLFYSGHDGRIYLAHPVPGAGLAGNPQPQPWAPTAGPNGPALAAATGPLGTVVSYVATDGTVKVDLVDPNGQWQAAIAASGPGFVAGGASTGVTSNATELDIYCGNGSGRPGTIVVNPHIGGPGVWWPAGPPNSTSATTAFAAS
jgi:hypothetical protein